MRISKLLSTPQEEADEDLDIIVAAAADKKGVQSLLTQVRRGVILWLTPPPKILYDMIYQWPLVGCSEQLLQNKFLILPDT